MKVLCVAEKPSIAKAVANILGGGAVTTRNSANKYIKNYDFTFNFLMPLGNASVTMTSVMGHLSASDFDEAYRSWKSCNPTALFEAPISVYVPQVRCTSFLLIKQDMQAISDNIKSEVKYARAMVIWTDCDREGEHIGSEIVEIAREVNNTLLVKRARFSNIERM